MPQLSIFEDLPKEITQEYGEYINQLEKGASFGEKGLNTD